MGKSTQVVVGQTYTFTKNIIDALYFDGYCNIDKHTDVVVSGVGKGGLVYFMCVDGTKYCMYNRQFAKYTVVCR